MKKVERDLSLRNLIEELGQKLGGPRFYGTVYAKFHAGRCDYVSLDHRVKIEDWDKEICGTTASPSDDPSRA